MIEQFHFTPQDRHIAEKREAFADGFVMGACVAIGIMLLIGWLG